MPKEGKGRGRQQGALAPYKLSEQIAARVAGGHTVEDAGLYFGVKDKYARNLVRVELTLAPDLRAEWWRTDRPDAMSVDEAVALVAIKDHAAQRRAWARIRAGVRGRPRSAGTLRRMLDDLHLELWDDDETRRVEPAIRALEWALGQREDILPEISDRFRRRDERRARRR